MKNVNTKFALLALASVLTLGTLTTSCSNDDDGYEEPTNASIDPAVGTYKGKLTVDTGAFFGENTQDIVSLTGSLEGIFHFYGSNKNISVIAEKQSETELQYHYEGVKQ